MKKLKLTTTVMHHLFLWVYNWREEDFKIAFKTSHLGWNYQWDKFQGNLSQYKDCDSNCSASALIRTILNMDDLHQGLLMDYILNVKYAKNIISMDENKKWMDSVEFEALKENK